MPAHRTDVHAHYFGGTVAGPAGKQPAPGPRAPWSAQATLEAMERTQTAVQILSVPFIPQSQNGGDARALARRINEELATVIEQHAKRFGGLACLPGDDPDAMLDELAYALDALRLDGVALTSNVAGRYLGAPWWQPLLAELDRRAVPVLVHPTSCPHATELALGRHPSVIAPPCPDPTTPPSSPLSTPPKSWPPSTTTPPWAAALTHSFLPSRSPVPTISCSAPTPALPRPPPSTGPSPP